MTARLQLVIDDDEFEPSILPHAVHYLRGGEGALTELESQSLAEHHANYGPRPDCRAPDVGDALVEDLTRIGLTGRGGGHFPAGSKWRGVARVPGLVVVANGAEGEPLSRKDAALMELRPHLVLDGLACAAETLGAHDAVVWLHDGAHAARSAVLRALTERRAARVGEPRIRIAVGPDHYLTGQSSAVAEGVAGRDALPVFRRSPASRSNPPTLVHNVETLARIGLVARGIEAADTVLLSVADAETITVLELPDRCTVHDAIRAACGDVPPRAVLMGGYGGSWVGPAAAAAAVMRHSALTAHGLTLGAGVLSGLPQGVCGLAETARIAQFLADSSARACGPCVFGLADIASSMAKLAAPSRWHRREAGRLERFVAEVSGRGACHHPDGASRMVASALTVFGDDVAAHLRGHCLHLAPERGGRG